MQMSKERSQNCQNAQLLAPRTSIYLGLVINKAQKVSLLEATGYRTSST